MSDIGKLTFRMPETDAQWTMRLERLARTVATLEEEALLEAIKQWREEHGEWPKYAWFPNHLRLPTEDAPVNTIGVTCCVGNKPPPNSVVYLVRDWMERTEIDE